MTALLLAQTTRPDPLNNLFETVVQMFSLGDGLAQPAQLLPLLQNLMTVWAVVFIVVGLLCMFNGYRFYKVATVALALMIGMFGGYWLGEQIRAPFIIAGCGGVLLAVIAWPMMKYAVAVFGGLAGAFAGANLWSGFTHALRVGAGYEIPSNTYWIGALVGLLVCGMLAFILFKLSIVLFTSVTGSTLAVMGVLALLMSFAPWRDPISQSLVENNVLIPLLVFIPALIALILQETWTMGESPSPEKAKP